MKPRELLSFAFAILLPYTVWAHAQYRPFSTNRYLLVEFTSETLLLTYDITVGDIPAGEIKKRADDNGDGWLQEGELQAIRNWLERSLQAGFSLQLDGQPVTPNWNFFGEWGDLQTRLLTPMLLRFQAAVYCPAGAHRVLLYDRTELPVLEQSELLVTENNTVENLRVSSPSGSQPHIFWDGGQRPQPVEIRFVLHVGSFSKKNDKSAVPVDELSSLKKALLSSRLGWTGWLWTVLLAVLLGSGHALSPGHGKTIVAAYLVGTGGRLRHALALGAVVTLAHVSSVIVLGLVALWATEKMLPEKLAPWLEMVSGLLVLVVSCSLLWKRIQILRGEIPEHFHHHSFPDNHHPQNIPQSSNEKESQLHHHQPNSKAVVRWSELISLGLSGGLVPCPSALVLLLIALYNRQLLAGLLLILAFTLGLSLTLVVVGFLAVSGIRFFTARSSGQLTFLKRWLPIGSAIFLVSVGIVMTASALASLL